MVVLQEVNEVVLVIGNSSSGIVEATVMKIPVNNVGNRQKGAIYVAISGNKRVDSYCFEHTC